MAEHIEVVIKIPQEDYDGLINNGFAFMQHIVDSIRNGVPLPKGHGDLIDKSKLLTVTDYDGENEKTYVLYEEIENAQPIIKADKAESKVME